MEGTRIWKTINQQLKKNYKKYTNDMDIILNYHGCGKIEKDDDPYYKVKLFKYLEREDCSLNT